MNICFINYFLYINLKEVRFFYFKSPSYCNLGPDVRLNFWCISAARLWCCNIFWGNGSRIKLFLKSKVFNWWTVSQCHMRSKWWYYNAPKFRGKRKIGYLLVLFRSRIFFVGLFVLQTMIKCEHTFSLKLKSMKHGKRDELLLSLMLYSLFTCEKTTSHPIPSAGAGNLLELDSEEGAILASRLCLGGLKSYRLKYSWAAWIHSANTFLQRAVWMRMYIILSCGLSHNNSPIKQRKRNKCSNQCPKLLSQDFNRTSYVDPNDQVNDLQLPEKPFWVSWPVEYKRLRHYPTWL